MRWIVALLGMLLTASSVSAQTSRYPVYIQDEQIDDVIGRQFVYTIRELLAKSALFIEADEIGQGDTISVLSLDVDGPDNPKGVQAAISVMHSVVGECQLGKGETWLENLSTHAVMLVGRNKVETQASATLAAYSDWLKRVSRQLPHCNFKPKARRK